MNIKQELIFITGLVFELISLYMLIKFKNNLTTPIISISIGFHVIASFLSYYFYELKKNNCSEFIILLLIILFFFPIGYIASAIMYYYILKFSRQRDIFKEYQEYITEKPETDNIELKNIDNYLSEIMAYNKIQPIVDILQSDNTLMRRAAAKKLGDIPEKESVKLLKNLLNDTDREVKFYASSSLIKIEEDINKRIKDIEKKVKIDQSNFALVKKLGIEYFDYTDIGLLDSKTADYFLNISLQYFITASKIEDDSAINNFIAKIYLKLKKYNKAMETLDHIIEKHPENYKAYFWRAECNYNLKNFKNVIEDIKSVNSFDNLPEIIKTVLPVWI